MSKYRAVIFDLDGTLLNTIDDLAAGVNHVLALHGYPVHSVPEVQSMVGNGVARLMALVVPEGTAADEQSAMLAEFRKYYFSHSEVYTKPYDGIEKLLAGLQSRGIKTAVTSNKFDAAVKKLCDKYFGSLVTVAIGESADTPKILSLRTYRAPAWALSAKSRRSAIRTPKRLPVSQQYRSGSRTDLPRASGRAEPFFIPPAPFSMRKTGMLRNDFFTIIRTLSARSSGSYCRRNMIRTAFSIAV